MQNRSSPHPYQTLQNTGNRIHICHVQVFSNFPHGCDSSACIHTAHNIQPPFLNSQIAFTRASVQRVCSALGGDKTLHKIQLRTGHVSHTPAVCTQHTQGQSQAEYTEGCSDYTAANAKCYRWDCGMNAEKGGGGLILEHFARSSLEPIMTL